MNRIRPLLPFRTISPVKSNWQLRRSSTTCTPSAQPIWPPGAELENPQNHPNPRGGPPRPKPRNSLNPQAHIYDLLRPDDGLAQRGALSAAELGAFAAELRRLGEGAAAGDALQRATAQEALQRFLDAPEAEREWGGVGGWSSRSFLGLRACLLGCVLERADFS